MCTRFFLHRQRVIQKCWEMEKEGGGRMRQHPHGARYDQDGPAIPGHHGQVIYCDQEKGLNIC